MEKWVGEEWLEGEVELDGSIRMALAVGRRVVGDGGEAARTSLFCGTSKGPVGVMLGACQRLGRRESLPEVVARQVMLGVGAMGAIVAERLGIGGPVHTSVAACASGLHALHRAAGAIWRGECARALVIAADASLHPLFEASFARLGVLAPADGPGGGGGGRRCEPFGEKGEGFFLAEGAAAVVLEKCGMRNAQCGWGGQNRETPPPRNAKRETGEGVLAWLEESWRGGDGTGLLTIDPGTDSLRRGLGACVGDGGAKELAFVHAHATGTGHDRYELEAIRAVVGREVPVFSSKGFLGHSLGAAGLVSVALSVQCHRKRVTLFGQPLERDSTSLTVAQGFGGHAGIVRVRGA